MSLMGAHAPLYFPAGHDTAALTDYRVSHVLTGGRNAMPSFPMP